VTAGWKRGTAVEYADIVETEEASDGSAAQFVELELHMTLAAVRRVVHYNNERTLLRAIRSSSTVAYPPRWAVGEKGSSQTGERTCQQIQNLSEFPEPTPCFVNRRSLGFLGESRHDVSPLCSTWSRRSKSP